MSDLEDLFRNGEEPTRSELERWLRTETDADPDDIADLVDDYWVRRSAGLRNDNWNPTPESLRRWFADFKSVYEGTPVEETSTGRPPSDEGGGRGGGLAQATEQIAEAAAAEERRQQRRRRPPSTTGRGEWLEDAGPSVDPVSVGTSVAVGVWTDESGNPILDENGQPIPVTAQSIWEEIRGSRFNMGRLTRAFPPPRRTTARVESEVAGGYAPKYMSGRDLGTTTRVASEVAGGYGRYKGRTKPQGPSRFLTPSQVMAMLDSMDDDALIGLQARLLDAGLYGESLPSWGTVDVATRTAVRDLFGEASLTPDESVDQVLARLVDEQVRRGAEAGGEGGAGGTETPTFQPEVTSAATLSAMIDDLAQDLTGQFLPEDRKAELIARLQGGEVDTQRQAFSQDVATQGGPAGEIDAFMTAIAGGETTATAGGGYGTTNQIGAHGRYQIMPANWGPWAERAGLGRNAPQTPQNQEIVARHVMLQYYNQFGNWRDVAIAWFAGPGAVGAPGAENRRDVNNMTVRRYADEAVARMSQLQGQPPPPGAVGEMPAIVRYDPQSEAEAIIRSQDPAAWTAHQFGKRATEYYQLLQGVVGG